MKKIITITILISLSSIGWTQEIETLRNSSEINNIDKNSMEEIETQIPEPAPVKINAGNIDDFLCGLGSYSNCNQAMARRKAELEYIKNSLNKATELAVEMLNEDFVPLIELDHRVWTQYYAKAVNRIKSTYDASSPSPEAFNLLIYVNERTLWITESAAEQSSNLSQLAKIIDEPFARIRNSVFNAKSLKQIRSDVDIITSQFLNNRQQSAERKESISPKIYVTPVTANWGNTMLVKFIRGADINTVMYVLKATGLSSDKFADNGNGFYVRVDIKDSDAPEKALLLANYTVVESVQVNRNVYDLLTHNRDSGDKKVNFCWFKELKENTCVYKCKNGTTYETPAQRPVPWNEYAQFIIPCPQLVFPF